MADKRTMGIVAAVVLLLATVGAAFFVVKSFLLSSPSEDTPAVASNATAAAPGAPPIEVGIFLSDFSANGPHRQSSPYGYGTQLRALRPLHDPAIHLVPVIEPNTAGRQSLSRTLSRNFPGMTPVELTNAPEMAKLDVLVATAAANLTPSDITAITQCVSNGMGFIVRQPGYLTPGYNPQTNALCGFADGVFGFSASPVECEIVGDHPLLGDLTAQKTITLVPNGAVGHLIGIPLLRVKDMHKINLVNANRAVGAGEYLYPLYISQLGKGKIVGIGFTQTADVPEALDAAHHGRFLIHCVQWLVGKPLN